MKAVFGLLKETYREWKADKAARLAAAIAYYTIFAVAPLLVLLVLIVGAVFGPDAARGDLFDRLSGTVGPETATLLQEMVDNAGRRTAGDILPSLFGFIALAIGATGLFTALEDALNTVWDIQPEAKRGFLRGLRTRVVDRFWSFLLVIGLGLLMIAALVASTALNVILGSFGDLIPGYSSVLYVANVLVSLTLLAVSLAAIYKVLPRAKIAWGDVAVGAAFTAILFVAGKEVLSLYLGRASVGSVYGAAGSLVVLLVWVYYTAQILLFGAEFTEVYARHYGSRAGASKDAARVTARPHHAQSEVGRATAASEARPGESQDDVEAETANRRRGLGWALAERYASLVVGAAFGWLVAMTGFPRGRR